MMLPDAESREPDLIGVHDLFDQIAQLLRRSRGIARRIERGRREAIDAEFDRLRQPN